MKFDIFDISFTHLMYKIDADMYGSHVNVRVSTDVSAVLTDPLKASLHVEILVFDDQPYS